MPLGPPSSSPAPSSNLHSYNVQTGTVASGCVSFDFGAHQGQLVEGHPGGQAVDVEDGDEEVAGLEQRRQPVGLRGTVLRQGQTVQCRLRSSIQ